MPRCSSTSGRCTETGRSNRARRSVRLLWMSAVMLHVLLTPAASCLASVWQWSVDVPGIMSAETGGPPQAYLWIGPSCDRVRAVIVGQHNMEEELILSNPHFRQQLEKLGVAAVWVTPPLDPFFRFDQGAGEHFNAMMAALADESGYDELCRAPVIPIGHSAAASYPWNFAAWAPQRTLAAISVSGQWPLWKDPSMPDWGSRTIDGVPGLVTMGEYEWAEDRAAEGLRQRAAHPHWPLTIAAEPGAGHFDASNAEVDLLALYIRKACQHRLRPAGETGFPVKLRAIDPTREGWLVERWHRNRPATVPPAPVGSYTGDARQAFWCFDEEMARAIEDCGNRYRGQQVQLLGYEQQGQVVPQDPKTHQQVTLRLPPLDESLSFKLHGVFLDEVPPGRPERWTGQKAGSQITHSDDADKIRITRICGPVQKLADDRFAICFDRLGFDNAKRSGEIWLLAEHPGNNQYRRSVQQSLLRIPAVNKHGASQHITFPEITNRPADSKPFRLNATSDADVDVHYYVVAGPAEVVGDELRLTPLPPRSSYPVKVTVAAWQWGRTTEPQLQSATPVRQVFRVTRPSSQPSAGGLVPL